MMHKFLSIVGTRPHLTKLAPVAAAFREASRERRGDVTHAVVHTGQHYDANLAGDFLEPLRLLPFEHQLEAGGRPPHEQLSYLISALTPLITSEDPAVVLVYGDTTSTAAGAIAARMAGYPVAHVEAGLREFDLSVPEEANKRIVDSISSLFLCPSQRAVDQLRLEGIERGVYLTGDTALDLQSWPTPASAEAWWDAIGLSETPYAVCTFHRACNTDDVTRLKEIVEALGRITLTILAPLHPRTSAALQRFGLTLPPNVRRVEPLGFFELQLALKHATLVLTDSGGVTKEAYQLDRSVVLLDDQTEWVEGVQDGYVKIAGAVAEAILAAAGSFHEARTNSRPYGSGNAGTRVVRACLTFADELEAARTGTRAPYRRWGARLRRDDQ